MDEIPANEPIPLPEQVEDAPRKGTLAWVRLQPFVDFQGLSVPVGHRIPADALLADPDALPEPGGRRRQGWRRCRVLRGDERCKAPEAGGLGLCMGHLGAGGAADLEAMQRASYEKRATLKATRQILGIGPARSADPRAAARIRAAIRADDLAKAIVDGPLDSSLDAAAKQRAALAAVDATYPLQTVTAELSLSDPDAMSWSDMQRVAVSLLG